MISYQIFTQTAVSTVVDGLVVYLPVLGSWLSYHLDTVVFIYAFAWVFVLSSIIPGLLLGKERSVFVQFLVVLSLTLLGFVLIDVVNNVYHFDLSNTQMIMSNQYMWIFSNIYFAIFYLSLPYIFMATIDYRARKKRGSQRSHVKKITDEYFDRLSPQKEPAAPTEDESAAET